jgi:Na+/melibiose symporter-like transporter
MPSVSVTPPPVGVRTKLFFGVGSLAQGAQTVSYSAYLLIFYNQVMGVPATLVSAALLISLMFDAISNPILGQFSDNTRSRWGRRHPYMYFAAAPTALLFWLMFNPPAGLSDGALFWYILIVSLLGRVAINFYELPSAALTPELTSDYDQRTSLMTWRYFFGYLGGLGIGTLLFFVLLQPTADYPIGQLNPEGYNRLGLIGGGLIFVSILVCSLGTHDRIKYARQATIRASLPLTAHLRELIQTLSHRGFLALLAFGVMKYTAAGMYAAMAVYFGTFVWELSPTSMGLLTFDGVVAATIALIAAPRLSRRFGKKPVAMTLAIIGVTISLTPLTLRLLGVFIPNEPESTLVAVLFAFAAFYGAATATSQIMTSSMIADVVEDSMIKTGRHSSGVFFAASSFMQTCTAGFGVLAAGLVLYAAGFPERARPGEVSSNTIDMLLMIYLPAAALLWLIGVSFLHFYRIDRTSHESNLNKLAQAGAVQGEVDASDPDFSLAGKTAPAA